MIVRHVGAVAELLERPRRQRVEDLFTRLRRLVGELALGQREVNRPRLVIEGIREEVDVTDSLIGQRLPWNQDFVRHNRLHVVGRVEICP